MKQALTPAQLNLLRRCNVGLRVWEVDAEYTRLLAELNVLHQLKLVVFEEGRGYETTANGEARLIELDE